MFNYLSCNIYLIDWFCGVNFDHVALFGVPFFFLLFINEYVDKITNWPREVHRKIGHVISGLIILYASYFLGSNELIMVAIMMIVGTYMAKQMRFNSIYQVPRKTNGSLYYAVVVALMAILWVPDQVDLFRLGILILVIPDALAAVVGSQWGKQIPFFNKSLLGSLMFFAGSVFVVALFTTVWWVVLCIAFILTAIEFFSQWGTDNLLLPIAAGYLLILFT